MRKGKRCGGRQSELANLLGDLLTYEKSFIEQESKVVSGSMRTRRSQGRAARQELVERPNVTSAPHKATPSQMRDYTTTNPSQSQKIGSADQARAPESLPEG